jgi:hypothetical protein
MLNSEPPPPDDRLTAEDLRVKCNSFEKLRHWIKTISACRLCQREDARHYHSPRFAFCILNSALLSPTDPPAYRKAGSLISDPPRLSVASATLNSSPLSEQLVVIRVGSDPEPDNFFAISCSYRAVVPRHTNRPDVVEILDFLNLRLGCDGSRLQSR